MAKTSTTPKKTTKPTKKALKTQPTAETSLFHQQLFQLLTDIKNVKDMELFANDFFTDSERQTFAKRLIVLQSLREGLSYEKIRKKYGVSSATISSVAENMSSKGLQLALHKMNIEAWAEKWSEKLSKFF